MDIPVYCITIRTRTDRIDTLKQHLEKRGIKGTIIDGIIIDDLEKKSVNPIASNGQNIDAFRACTLSHRKALQTMLDNNDEYAIIVEDDARFCKDFKETLALILEKTKPINNNNLLLLSPFPFSYEGVTHVMKINDTFKIFTMAQYVFSACGYVVSREMCQKIIEKIDTGDIVGKTDEPVSTERYVTQDSENGLFVTPPLVIESVETPSSLWAGSEKYHSKFWSNYDLSNYL